MTTIKSKLPTPAYDKNYERIFRAKSAFEQVETEMSLESARAENRELRRRIAELEAQLSFSSKGCGC